jgi:hypothetical protein
MQQVEGTIELWSGRMAHLRYSFDGSSLELTIVTDEKTSDFVFSMFDSHILGGVVEAQWVVKESLDYFCQKLTAVVASIDLPASQSFILSNISREGRKIIVTVQTAQ